MQQILFIEKELHAADIRAENVSGEIGGGPSLKVLPEIIDLDSMSIEEQQNTLYTHSLYGVITEAADQPFPFSLDNANDRENIVDEPFVEKSSALPN